MSTHIEKYRDSPTLAIIDGRFLPLDDFQYTIEKDNTNIRTVSGNNLNVRVGMSINGSFTTERDAEPRRRACDGFVRLDDRLIRLVDTIITDWSDSEYTFLAEEVYISERA